MSFFGIPRGRRKAASTIRITIDNDNPTNNATLYLDSDSGTTVTLATSGWLELIASTTKAINYIQIFDSQGFTGRLALGAPASETDLILIEPGGPGFIPVKIDPGQRVSIRPLAASPVGAEIVINFYD